jgi:hypothetical protein
MTPPAPPRLGRLALALGLLFATLGCAEDEGGGAIDVSWTIGGSTCNQSGVSKMVVSLYVGGEVVKTHDALCIDGTTRVSGVEAGTYVVEVTAYRADSPDPTYVGQVSGVSVPKGGLITAPEVELEEAPGAIDLQWRFDTGQLCRFAGVSWITVGIFDVAGRRAAQRELPCDPEPEAATDEPGSSYLAGATGVVFDRLLPGGYTVNVFAFADAGDALPTHYGNADATVSVYKLAPVEVVLTACPEGDDSPCL